MFVTVTIPADKEAEFKEVMAADVTGSRAEAGCLRFDLIKGETGEGGTKYHFYEAYTNAEAMTFHKEQPHYKKWADFKAANMDTVGASQVCTPTLSCASAAAAERPCGGAARRVLSRAMVRTRFERRYVIAGRVPAVLAPVDGRCCLCPLFCHAALSATRQRRMVCMSSSSGAEPRRRAVQMHGLPVGVGGAARLCVVLRRRGLRAPSYIGWCQLRSPQRRLGRQYSLLSS